MSRGESPPRPRHRADHPFGKPVDRDEEQRAVEDEAIVDEPSQQFGQQGEGKAPDYRTRDAAEPTEQEREEKEDRGLEGEAVGGDVAVGEGEERARRSREGGRDGEGHDANVVGREPQGLGGDLALLDGDKSAAPARASKIGGQPEGERGREGHGPVVSSKGGLRDVEDPARASRHRAPLDQHALDDDAEGDRDHGEVGA